MEPRKVMENSPMQSISTLATLETIFTMVLVS